MPQERYEREGATTMTDLEHKIDVMQHFKNGGEVETLITDNGEWILNPEPAWNWVAFEYRKKETPKLRPWKKEEFKFQPIVWGEQVFIPVRWNDDGVCFVDELNDKPYVSLLTWKQLFDRCETLDGGPCGVEE